MIAPSAMLSGGTGSLPMAATLYPVGVWRSSTAFTALDPMSSPTSDLGRRKNAINRYLARLRKTCGCNTVRYVRVGAASSRTLGAP